MPYKPTEVETELLKSIRQLRNGMRHAQVELVEGSAKRQTIAVMLEGYLATARTLEKAALAMGEANTALAGIVSAPHNAK